MFLEFQIYYIRQYYVTSKEIGQNIAKDIEGRCHGLIENNNSAFWDMTPNSPAKVDRHFGGICNLHLEGQLAAFFMSVFACPEDGGDILIRSLG